MAEVCRRKVVVPIFLALLLILGICGVAIYVVVYYGGSSTSVSSGDILLLTDRTSSFWCRAQTITMNPEKTLGFNASVVPRVSTVRAQQSFHVNPTLPSGHGRALWHFKMQAGSKIETMQCSDIANVLVLVMRGSTVLEECVKNTPRFFHDSEESIEPLTDDCNSIVIARTYMKTCRRGLQLFGAPIPADDDYLIIFDSILTEVANIRADIKLVREVYDVSNALYNCSNKDSCFLPLAFGTSNTIVAQMDLNSKGDTGVLKWSCVRRDASFAVVFAAVPLLVFVSVTLGTCICRIRKTRRRGSTAPVQSRVENPDERTRLLSGSTTQITDPILEKVGPIPGPYQYHPTAPPNPENGGPVTNGIPHLPSPPTEEPPTYEETMNEGGSNRRAVAAS